MLSKALTEPSRPPAEIDEPPLPSSSEGSEGLVFPTTVGQKRFWSLDAFQPGNPALNMPLAARLAGTVNRTALHQALNEILRRHEVLRSRFEKEGDELVQVLCPAHPIQMRWLDCTATPADAVAAKTQEVMLEEGHGSFDLSKGPFLRGALATFSPSEHVLMLTMHHAVSDGWSNGIVIREFAENYSRIMRGEQPPFSDLELQYADYAVWQRDWLGSREGIAQKNFWDEQLGEIIPVLNLPTDAPRGRKASTNGTIASRLLPMDLSESFRQACQQENATSFMGYLAAYVALLRRYSSREEFVVGSPAACRNQTELESMVGLFANPMLIRLRVTPKMTFRQLLQHVRDTTLASVARQEYPFEIIAENLRGEDSRRGVPWLQAYFVYQKAFMQPQHMPGLELTPLRSISAGAVFEWFLGPVERKEGVRLQLEYNTDLFSSDTIERAMAHVHTFIAQAVRSLDFSIGELGLNETSSPGPFAESSARADVEKPLDSPLASISAAFAGDDSALFCSSSGQRLRLSDLRKNAACTHELITALPQDRPLRIGVPTDNFSFAVSSTLSVCDIGHLAVLLPVTGPSEAIHLDAVLGGSLLAPTLVRANPPARPETAAGGAIVFGDELAEPSQTVPNTSFAFLRRQAAELAGHLGLRSDDRLISLASVDTRTAWEELLASFHVGATVLQTDPSAAEAGATVIFITSARCEELLRSNPAAAKSMLRSVRLLVLDHEPLSLPAARALRNLTGPELRIAQRFQPQEGGLTVAIQFLGTPASASAEKPAQNCFLLPSWNLDLVDLQGVRCPRGVPGRVDLSSCWWLPGHKPLRTSHFARWRSDGSFEWLGESADLDQFPVDQLEKKQLRDVACLHAAVWNAYSVAVQPSERAPAGVILHVVPLPEALLSASDLATFLEEKLPAYLLPTKVVVHHKIPLTTVGRVDYAVLRELRWLDQIQEPTTRVSPTDSGGPAPEGEIEIKLAALYAELLRVDKVDVRASFFNLGGHSLLGVKLFARIEKLFQLRLPLATLLTSPSARQLSKRIREAQAGPIAWNCLVPLQTTGTGPRFYCVHGAGGNVLLYRDLARRLSPEVRFFGLQAQGLDGQAACLTSVEAMAELYLREILAEQPEGPYFLGGYCMGGNIAYEIGQLLLRKGHTVGFIAMLDSYNLRKSLYTGSALDRFRIFLQKGSFHLDTLAHLKMSQRKTYLAEKIRMAVEMVQARSRAMLRGRQPSCESDDPGARLVAFVQNANHVALKAHHPKPFAGNLVLFRPRKNYHTFPDPQMGWGELTGGQLSVVGLSANPHAMLLEPFVQDLGEQLKARILAALPSRR